VAAVARAEASPEAAVDAPVAEVQVLVDKS